MHPTAVVETDQVGVGTRIWAFAHVLAGASIGSNCNIGDHCFVESGATIGNDVTIKNGTAVWEGVSIEDGAFIGPSVVFTNDLRPRSPRLSDVAERYSDRRWLSPTVVGRGATLGAGSVIVAGITIGEFAFVAAGAVVTRDVDPHALVIGVPAHPQGFVCRCGAALDVGSDPASCSACGATYTVVSGRLQAI